VSTPDTRFLFDLFSLNVAQPVIKQKLSSVNGGNHELAFTLYIHGATWWCGFGAVASQQVGSWFRSRFGPFFVEFACSPHLCVGSLRVLPPVMQKEVCQIN